MGCNLSRSVYIIDDSTSEPDDQPPGTSYLGCRRRRSDVSLRTILLDPSIYQAFRQFLQEEFCEQSFLFWIEVDQYTKIDSPKRKREKAAHIYDTYIAEGAAHCVDLDHETRDGIHKSLTHASIEDLRAAFDLAHAKTFHKLKFDFMPRFLTSKAFSKMSTIQSEDEDSDLDSHAGSTHALSHFFRHPVGAFHFEQYLNSAKCRNSGGGFPEGAELYELLRQIHDFEGAERDDHRIRRATRILHRFRSDHLMAALPSLLALRWQWHKDPEKRDNNSLYSSSKRTKCHTRKGNKQGSSRTVSIGIKQSGSISLSNHALFTEVKEAAYALLQARYFPEFQLTFHFRAFEQALAEATSSNGKHIVLDNTHVHANARSAGRKKRSSGIPDSGAIAGKSKQQKSMAVADYRNLRFTRNVHLQRLHQFSLERGYDSITMEGGGMQFSSIAAATVNADGGWQSTRTDLVCHSTDLTLEDLLCDSLAVHYLKRFCQLTLQSENLNFWLEVQAFKGNRVLLGRGRSLSCNSTPCPSSASSLLFCTHRDSEHRYLHAVRIAHEYVVLGAQYQINISAAMRFAILCVLGIGDKDGLKVQGNDNDHQHREVFRSSVDPTLGAPHCSSRIKTNGSGSVDACATAMQRQSQANRVHVPACEPAQTCDEPEDKEEDGAPTVYTRRAMSANLASEDIVHGKPEQGHKQHGYAARNSGTTSSTGKYSALDIRTAPQPTSKLKHRQSIAACEAQHGPQKILTTTFLSVQQDDARQTLPSAEAVLSADSGAKHFGAASLTTIITACTTSSSGTDQSPQSDGDDGGMTSVRKNELSTDDNIRTRDESATSMLSVPEGLFTCVFDAAAKEVLDILRLNVLPRFKQSEMFAMYQRTRGIKYVHRGLSSRNLVAETDTDDAESPRSDCSSPVGQESQQQAYQFDTNSTGCWFQQKGTRGE